MYMYKLQGVCDKGKLRVFVDVVADKCVTRESSSELMNVVVRCK